MKIVVLALGLILLSAAGLWGCGRDRELAKVSVDDSLPKIQKAKVINESGSPISSTENDTSEAKELIALADTREEAEEIAELYEIDLSSYSYGVATYTTDKNTQELIELGAEKGYPALTPSYSLELHTEQTTN